MIILYSIRSVTKSRSVYGVISTSVARRWTGVRAEILGSEILLNLFSDVLFFFKILRNFRARFYFYQKIGWNFGPLETRFLTKSSFLPLKTPKKIRLWRAGAGGVLFFPFFSFSAGGFLFFRVFDFSNSWSEVLFLHL